MVEYTYLNYRTCLFDILLPPFLSLPPSRALIVLPFYLDILFLRFLLVCDLSYYLLYTT